MADVNLAAETTSTPRQKFTLPPSDMLLPDQRRPGISQPSPAVPSNDVARRAALVDVISVMRIPWVRDYLLDLAPAAEASILASPLQRLHSVTWSSEMRVCGIAGGASPRDGTHTSIVMIPAFSRDGLTAFTRIEENNGMTPSPFVRGGFAHCRFVMSERDGSLVSARQAAGEPDKITIIAKQAPNGREQVSQAYVFQATSLRALTQRATDGVVGVAEFERALIAALFLYNTGPCKICGGPAHVACGCKLSYGRSQHALDFSYVQKNTTASLGHYDGFGVVEYFDRGQVQSVTAVGTTWNGVSDASYGVSNRLLSWAITQSLAATVPSVLRPLELAETPISVTEVDVPGPEGVDVMLLDDVDSALGSFDFSEFPETLLDQAPVVRPVNSVQGTVEPWECSNPLQSAGLPEIRDPVIATPVLSDEPERPVISARSSHGRPSESSTFTSSKPRTKAVPIAPLVLRENTRLGAVTVMSDEDMKKLRIEQQKIRNRESAARSNQARKKRREMLKLQQATEHNGDGHEGLREAVHS